MISGSMTAKEGPERQRDKAETLMFHCPPASTPGHYIPSPPSCDFQTFLAASPFSDHFTVLLGLILGKGSGKRGITILIVLGGGVCVCNACGGPGSPRPGDHTWRSHMDHVLLWTGLSSTFHGMTPLSLTTFLSGPHWTLHLPPSKPPHSPL